MSRPLRVVIVDDEPLTRERVTQLVHDTTDLDLVGVGVNGLEALNLITSLRPDLVFIDVEMPELSGFGVIAALESSAVPGVVFITAFEQYALQAFDVGAIDYLHKPITPSRFAAAVERARGRIAAQSAGGREALVSAATQADRHRGMRTRFIVRRPDNTHYFVAVEAVDWIDVASNYLRLHVGDRVHLWRGTLSAAEEELDPKLFVRIHRSVIVALDRVAAVRSHPSGGFEVQLQRGTLLRTSRQYEGRVREVLAAG